VLLWHLKPTAQLPYHVIIIVVVVVAAVVAVTVLIVVAFVVVVGRASPRVWQNIFVCAVTCEIPAKRSLTSKKNI